MINSSNPARSATSGVNGTDTDCCLDTNEVHQTAAGKPSREVTIPEKGLCRHCHGNYRSHCAS